MNSSMSCTGRACAECAEFVNLVRFGVVTRDGENGEVEGSTLQNTNAWEGADDFASSS